MVHTFTVRIELEKIHREPGKGETKVRNEPINGQGEPINNQNEPINGQSEPINGKNEPIKSLKAQIIELLRAKPDMSYEELAKALDASRTTIMRHVQELKGKGVLLRLSPKKTGHWKICLEKTT